VFKGWTQEGSGRMITEELLRYGLWAFIFSLLFTTWLINFKNNHYKRGFYDGYQRGKIVSRERFID
jgi:hypothetical protein